MELYQQCPICGYISDWITNVHCQKEHGLTKKEVEEKYGIKKFRKNLNGNLTLVDKED